MLIREELEKREHLILSERASFADKATRLKEEEKDFLRTEFQRDRDRIIHSKSFRRLVHKTQVFLAPELDHFRTRLTHTLEVSQIARTIARNLNLNEDLTEAIALGHDLGHTPFGHNGEKILNDVFPAGFKHNEQSLRVLDKLEKGGLNLTLEVRDGILNHSGKNMPFTLEGEIVRISDRIAYINHDIDDAIRSGVITGEDLPKNILSGRNRIDEMVNNLIETSQDLEYIRLSHDYQKAQDDLRAFLFENVYRNSKVKKDEDLDMVDKLIRKLYYHFVDNPDELPEDFYNIYREEGSEVAAKDYVACMTDRYALNLFEKI
ncbi:MAG: deoxyguanosinetriphosphate triphosphohydrolase [Clostridia bacterium]|nr:deoxyguanosinetriphosphate triphosphohydrolase [Clostridia bacterium]